MRPLLVIALPVLLLSRLAQAAGPVPQLNVAALREESLLGDPRFQNASPFKTVQFSADGKQVFLGGVSMSLWEFPSGKNIARFDTGIPPGNFTTACRIPNASNCIYAKRDGALELRSTVILADMRTGKELWHIHHDALIVALAPSEDGSRIIAGDDKGRIIFWDSVTGRELRRDTMPTPIARLQLSSDQKSLIWSDAHGLTGFLRLADSATEPSVDLVHLGFVTRENLAAFSLSDDRTRAVFTITPGELSCVDLSNRTVLWKISVPGATKPNFSPDGSLVSIGSTEKRTVLQIQLDARTGLERGRIELKSPSDFRGFTPDSKAILLDQSGCLARYDVTTSAGIFPEDPAPLSGAVGPIIPTADDQGLFISSPTSGISRYNLQTGARTQICQPGVTLNSAVAVSPDESRLLANNSSRISIFDIKAQKELAALFGSGGATDTWIWSADGNHLAGPSLDGAVIADGHTAKVLKESAQDRARIYPSTDPQLVLSFHQSRRPSNTLSPALLFWDIDSFDIIAQVPLPLTKPTTSDYYCHFWGCTPGNRALLLETDGNLTVYCTPQFKPLSPEQVAQVKAACRDLSNSDFARRDAATKLLKAIGPSADSLLAGINPDDPETLSRAAEIRAQWRPATLAMTPLPDSLPGDDADHYIKQLAIHPDGTHFAFIRGTNYTGNSINLGEITPTGPKETRRIQNDNGPNCLAFSHDGKKLYVGNRNATISIYSVSGDQEKP